MERWFAGRGPAARAALLACGHWAAAARPIVPRVAGRAGIPYSVAGPVLAVSGAAWATTLVLLGDQLGAHVLDVAGVAPLVALALLVAGLAGRSWRVRVGRKATFPPIGGGKVAFLPLPRAG